MLKGRPGGEHAVSQRTGGPAEFRQFGAVDRRLGDDGKAVQNPLAGGSGAPGPVFVRNTSEVVGCAAVGTGDESVAADQPAGAGVGELAGNISAGERAPFVAVGGLGLNEQSVAWGETTQ